MIRLWIPWPFSIDAHKDDQIDWALRAWTPLSNVWNDNLYAGYLAHGDDTIQRSSFGAPAGRIEKTFLTTRCMILGETSTK
jgi:hypothetical protein